VKGNFSFDGIAFRIFNTLGHFANQSQLKEAGRDPVRQSRISKRWWSTLLLIALALLLTRTIGSARSSPNQSVVFADSAAPQQLSAESQAWLRATIQPGNLADLRWPDFSDYSGLLQKFYESYGYSLPWVRGMAPTPQAQQIIEVLSQADQKGLSPDDYDGPRWPDRLAKLKPAKAHPSEADAARFDLALTVCVMRYISDLHIGKVNPKHFEFGFDIQAKKYDLPQFLKEDVVDSSNLVNILEQVEPPYPGYRRTIKALDTYLGLAKQYDGKQLPPIAKTVAPGDSYAGVPQLTVLLRLLGDLPPDANVPADSIVYQGPLVDAVRSFQSRHGREPDGRIGTQTLADLNVPLTSRVRQMQLTLERWRWLPLAYHAAPIVANIPEFRLRAYDENFRIALTMNVVVGKAFDHSTPVFEDSMAYVVFRPYWNVPYSIAKSEFLSKIARDPDYLTKKGFEVVNSRQQPVTAGPVTNDVLDQLRAGKLFIRQLAGPKNSLGLVKFIFPNDYSVYMHDSPEQQLFSKSRRDFSHGCIRLERPADLAAWVLRDNPGWNADRVRAAMNGTTTNQQVNLDHPVPVLIVYATVIVGVDGVVHFYDDIYGHDAALEKVLAKGYPYPG
jgi:murein L,D-transpeptidase YcbB/YkuD